MNETEEEDAAVSECQIDDVEGDQIEAPTAGKFLREHLDCLFKDIAQHFTPDENPELELDGEYDPSEEIGIRINNAESKVEVRELQQLTAEDLLEMIKRHQPLITSGRFTHLDFFVFLPPFISLGKINSININVEAQDFCSRGSNS